MNRMTKISLIFTIGFVLGCCSSPTDDLKPSIRQRVSASDIEEACNILDEFPELLPIDQSSSNQSYSAFQESLKAAIYSRDSTFIYSILDPNINLSFGGDYGLSDFKRMWHIENSESEFWSEFEQAIILGGYFLPDSQNYIFPYLFRNLPQGYDGFLHTVAINDSARLYLRPSEDSGFCTVGYKIVGTLTWDQIQEEAVEGFFPVKISDDMYSFGRRSDFRLVTDYRGQFYSDGVSWKLKYWIAGD